MDAERGLENEPSGDIWKPPHLSLIQSCMTGKTSLLLLAKIHIGLWYHVSDLSAC